MRAEAAINSACFCSCSGEETLALTVCEGVTNDCRGTRVEIVSAIKSRSGGDCEPSSKYNSPLVQLSSTCKTLVASCAAQTYRLSCLRYPRSIKVRTVRVSLRRDAPSVDVIS